MPVFNAAVKQPQDKHIFIAAILTGLLLPLLIYGVLPWLGLDPADRLLTPFKLILLPLTLLFTIGYYIYIRSVCKMPSLLSLGTWLLYPWLGFASHSLIYMGINLSQNMVMIAFVLLPTVIIGIQQLRSVWDRVPYLKPYLWFTAAMLLYFFFFQDDIQEQRSGGNPLTTLGFYYLSAILINLAQIILVTVGDKVAYFDQKFLKYFNRFVLLNTFLIGMIGIIGYPFEHFNILDNFTRRARSIFYHPAYFGHYMAFCIIYLLGYFFYYRELKREKRLLFLFLSVCLIGFIGFMLSLSKAAILAFAIAIVVMLLLNTTSWQKAIQQLKYGMILLLIGLCAIFGYEQYSGNAVFSSILQRFEESRSMDWRDRMNRYLELDTESIWFGHGMSSAKRRMSMFEGYGRDDKDPTFSQMKVVHVHNSYLSQFYDYGLIGISLFIFLGVFAARRFLTVLKTPANHPNRFFNITILCLILYFLLICITDTAFETAECPFWVLLTAAVLAEGRVRRQWT